MYKERIDAMTIGTKKVLENKINRGKAFLEKLEKSSLNAYKENENLLFRLLDENKDTEYGRKYNFGSIKTIEDYINTVPFTEYEDYECYIGRMLKGEENILSARSTVHFATSSASSGKIKYVPMCQEAENLFAAYTHGLCFAVMDNELGEKWKKGRGVSFTEVRFKPAENGISIGAVSGKVRFQHKENENLVYTTPQCISYPEDKMNFRYLHLLFALMEEDLSFITCTFMNAMADAMRYLQENWQMFINDIKTGTINNSILIPQDIKEEISSLIKPMPERAAFLKAEFEKGFEGIMERIWPNLQFVFGIGGGSFKVHTEKAKYYLGNIRVHYSIYSASEGIFAAPVSSETEDMLLLPFSAFFEFRDTNSEENKTVTLDKVEAGHDYEIIITNLSGLYRYRIKDVVRVTGFFNSLPKIQFLYRLNQLINIAGEKTNDNCMNDVMKFASQECGLGITEYSVYADTDTSPGRYVIFAECYDGQENLSAEQVAKVIEKYLCKFNPSYKDKIINHKLSPLKFHYLKANTYETYRDLVSDQGVSPNQLKPVRLIDNSFKKDFFFSMTEK